MLETRGSIPPPLEDDDDDEEEIEFETKTRQVFNWELVNRQKAIWARSAADVSDEEYQNFFKSITDDYNDALTWSHFKAEGEIEFKSILFVPSKAPFDMYDNYHKQKSGLRLYVRKVLITDEFEELLRAMPVKFFQTLRGLRDNHKSQLSFLTFSREPVPVLIDKMNKPELEIEPFTELFTDNVYFVGPYNVDDASAMIESLIRRNPTIRYSNDSIQFLLSASGRFAGIMRAGFRELEILGDIGQADIHNPNLIERLARRNRVRTECETIWKSLTPVEQRVLHSVSRREPEEIDDASEQAIGLLVQKRLLRVDRNHQSLQIEPPVFGVYVRLFAEL